MELVFKKDKDTQNKVRFVLQEGPVQGSIYVNKDQAGDRTEIPVTVALD